MFSSFTILTLTDRSSRVITHLSFLVQLGLGDKVALKILKDAASHQAHTALTACKRLYKKNDSFSLVFGGTVFQKAKPAIQIETISERVKKRYPNVKIVTLRDEPVLGALWFALDLLHDGEAPKKTVASFKAFFACDHEKQRLRSI